MLTWCLPQSYITQSKKEKHQLQIVFRTKLMKPQIRDGSWGQDESRSISIQIYLDQNELNN